MSLLDSKPGGLLEIFQDIHTKYGLKVTFNETFLSETPVAMDVEHDEQGGFVGVGFYDSNTNTVCYFSDLSLLTSIWICSLDFIAHNGVSDLEVLQSWGFPVRYSQLVHDTMLIGHIIDSSLKAYGLKDMAKRELGIEYPDYAELVGKGKNKTTLDKLPAHIVALYNGMDVYSTYKLYERQKSVLY